MANFQKRGLERNIPALISDQLENGRPESQARVSAIHRAIANMWPDDHESMLALEERRALRQCDLGTDRKPSHF